MNPIHISGFHFQVYRSCFTMLSATNEICLDDNVWGIATGCGGSLFLSAFLTKSCINAPVIFVMCVCLRVTTHEPANGFSWNLILGRFTKFCQHVPVWLKLNKTGTLKEDLFASLLAKWLVSSHVWNPRRPAQPHGESSMMTVIHPHKYHWPSVIRTSLATFAKARFWWMHHNCYAKRTSLDKLCTVTSFTCRDIWPVFKPGTYRMTGVEMRCLHLLISHTIQSYLVISNGNYYMWMKSVAIFIIQLHVYVWSPDCRAE
jgi:hypothetical protein